MHNTPPPTPSAAVDEATFVADLRRLKAWSGLSFRQLERRADAIGDSLPPAAIATMLSRNRVPHEPLLVAYLRACGLGHQESHSWTTLRTELEALPPLPTPTLPAAAPTSGRRHKPALAVAVAITSAAVLTATLVSPTDLKHAAAVLQQIP
ncbi:helix-turn-helix domain-containing protein [Nonomuraea sp. NPDC050536]|uniref:helix-turn-helix domain-containing protein n=1 Tax=Nonomuraea sp. NPDC050536 TaxID=3364366 RepID=UPI0037C5FBB6